MKKRIVFIGNRINVLQEALNESTWEVVKIFSVAGSNLSQHLYQTDIPFDTFSFKDKRQVVDEIQNLDFDILVSNGCPFILPISELASPSRMFLNTHPSLLPALKGPHPINGLFLFNHKTFGATTHYMLDDVDAGRIVAQVKHPLTKDLDLGLVYRLSFMLEADVFRSAISILKSTNYTYIGLEHIGEHSYYKRQPEDMIADSTKETSSEIVTKVKAFEISSLGVKIKLSNGELVKALNADTLTNEILIEKFSSNEPGDVILEYEGKLLIQCKTGLLRVNRWE